MKACGISCAIYPEAISSRRNYSPIAEKNGRQSYFHFRIRIRYATSAMPDPKTLLMHASSSLSKLTADELEPLIRGVLDRIAELQERLGHIGIETQILDTKARVAKSREISQDSHLARDVAVQTLIETLEALEQEVATAVERILRPGDEA